MREETRWAPGFEPEKPKPLPKGIRPPRFRSRKQVVKYCESRALMIERGELDPKVARALATFARVALEAWALELGSKAAALGPLTVEMIDYRGLVEREDNGG